MLFSKWLLDIGSSTGGASPTATGAAAGGTPEQRVYHIRSIVKYHGVVPTRTVLGQPKAGCNAEWQHGGAACGLVIGAMIGYGFTKNLIGRVVVWVSVFSAYSRSRSCVSFAALEAHRKQADRYPCDNRVKWYGLAQE